VPGTSFQFMYISIYYIYMPMPMPMPMPSGKHTHAWCGDKSKITAYFLGGAVLQDPVRMESCLHCCRTINAISCFNCRAKKGRIKVSSYSPDGSYSNNNGNSQMKIKMATTKVKSLRIRSVVLKFTACLVIFMHARSLCSFAPHFYGH